MRRQRGAEGFSLIELLVVMAILATLAAIAIPLFLHQRNRAHDASTKADVSNLAKELATYYVDPRGVISLDFSEIGVVALTDGTRSSTVNLTNGTAIPTSGASRDLQDPMAWCVALTDPAGAIKTFRYSAQDGLEAGTC